MGVRQREQIVKAKDDDTAKKELFHTESCLWMSGDNRTWIDSWFSKACLLCSLAGSIEVRLHECENIFLSGYVLTSTISVLAKLQFRGSFPVYSENHRKPINGHNGLHVELPNTRTDTPLPQNWLPGIILNKEDLKTCAPNFSTHTGIIQVFAILHISSAMRVSVDLINNSSTSFFCVFR